MCFQGNGECILGCVDGTWGQRCENTCHERCDACDRDNGECVRCEAGKFGTICERNCSENCLPSSDNSIHCSKDAGHCTEEACKSGFYGLTCNSTCNQNCAGNENGTVDCEINTGECSYNCRDGWFGPLCTGQCLDSCRNKRCVGEPDNCVDGCSDFYYGNRCQLLCNEGCKNGKCDDSGICTERCENGKYGLMCDKDCTEVCIDDACDIDSGRCEYCYNFTADNFHMCVTASMYSLLSVKCNNLLKRIKRFTCAKVLGVAEKPSYSLYCYNYKRWFIQIWLLISLAYTVLEIYRSNITVIQPHSPIRRICLKLRFDQRKSHTLMQDCISSMDLLLYCRNCLTLPALTFIFSTSVAVFSSHDLVAAYKISVCRFGAWLMQFIWKRIIKRLRYSKQPCRQPYD